MSAEKDGDDDCASAPALPTSAKYVMANACLKILRRTSSL
jgi:hypothetical protein